MDLGKIADAKLKNATTGELVDLKCFWQNQTSVVIFFRRWGCMYCRIWAKQVSEIIPYLRTKDVKVVGVGVEELGAKEFQDGKFFDGDIFIDQDHKTYNSLGFKRFNMLTIMMSFLWKESRSTIAQGRREGILGNLKGDVLQNGGALIVAKGGNLLKHYVQDGPAERLSNEEILKVLGLDEDYKSIHERKKTEEQTNVNK